MSTIEQAIVLATVAHTGQVDKAGMPYILHPLRVMMKASTLEEKIAAILHDVIEDSNYTIEDLRQQGFSEKIIQAVDALTHQKDEPYMEYILRAKANPIAMWVKIADLEDNCDLSRIKEPTERDYKRSAKYREALQILLS